MSLPKFLQSALWSYDISKMDLEEDKQLIITQILNHGTWKQVLWLKKTYSEKEIKEIIKYPSRGVWMEDALNFWLKIFDIKLPKNIIDRALFSLTIKNQIKNEVSYL